MDIFAITSDHPLWEKTRRFAEESAWPGGDFLAKQMRENRFLSWERVFVACEGEALLGYCDFTKKDELPETCDFSPFIGCVFVARAHRGSRISEKMIRAALRYAGSLGYKAVYLMSGELGLYEKYGFEKIGVYDTIFGTKEQLFVKSTRK